MSVFFSGNRRIKVSSGCFESDSANISYNFLGFELRMAHFFKGGLTRPAEPKFKGESINPGASKMLM